MKRIINCLIIIFCITATGCDDFLTVLPESEYSADGFYQSQKDFDVAIAAVYAQQQQLYYEASNWWRAITVRSDEMRSGEPYLNGFDRFVDGDNVSKLLEAWGCYWTMIYRCNTILDKIDNVEFSDNDLKNYVKGEAHMLRGYAYWSLACQFGGMPIIKVALTVEETLAVPRSSQADTYALAEEDMKTGYQLLPEVWTGDNLGRVTKYSAAGALARMLLYQSKFSDAKPYLKAIIESGRYHMEEKYEDCFIDSKDNSPERVWDVQFGEGQLGEGTRFISGLFPEGTNSDLTPFHGDAAAVAVSEQFVNKYEPGDLRKDISIITGLDISGVISNQYYICKYVRYSYTPKSDVDWANNFPLIRYTDVKMMYAEVLNEEGYVADGEAFDIINEVRDRAGLSALTSTEVPDQASFREAIIHERNIEFAFEGLRWFDLVRWGIAKEVMDKFFLDPAEGGGIYSMDEFRTIFAIPADELSRYNNKEVMWQNPGY